MKEFWIIFGLLSLFLAFLNVIYPDDNYDKWLTFVGAIVAFVELARRIRDSEPEEILKEEIPHEYESLINKNHRLIRNTIGVVSVSFPFIVLVFSTTYEPSLSKYYYTESRDIFVGSLIGIGFLLFIYPDKTLFQSAICKVLGILCMVIALVPTVCHSCELGIHSMIHFFAFTAFFLISSFYSLISLERGAGVSTQAKLRKVVMYRICRYGTWFSLSLFVAGFLLSFTVLYEYIENVKLFLFSEISLFVFFGLMWVTRGDVVHQSIE